jgi:6-phosphogluconate dehydrogenase
LKLDYGTPLSNFAFKFILRRYTSALQYFDAMRRARGPANIIQAGA